MNESNYDKSFDAQTNKSASKIENSFAINSSTSNLKRSVKISDYRNENIDNHSKKHSIQINEVSRLTEKSNVDNFEKNLDKSVNKKKSILLKPIANSRLNTSNKIFFNQAEQIEKSFNSKIKNNSGAYDDEFENFEQASKSKILESNKKAEKSFNKSSNLSKFD